MNQRVLRGFKLRLPDLDVAIAQKIGLKGLDDASVLELASHQGRILVTHDLKTVPAHAYERVRAGLPMSGVVC